MSPSRTTCLTAALLGGALLVPVAGQQPFEQPRLIANGQSPFDNALGDVDGDGLVDIVTRDGGVAVLLGDGLGGFTPLPVTANTWGRDATLTDLDGDGDLDLTLCQGPSPRFEVLLNDGTGVFTHDGFYATTGEANDLSLADVDGDGLLDAIVVNDDQFRVSLLLGNGDGTFQTKTDLGPTGERPTEIDHGDLDGDGDVDFVVANFYADTISVFVNDGAGGFPSPTIHPTGLVGFGVESPVLADVDEDGDLDAVVTAAIPFVFPGNGDGTFAAPYTLASSGAAGRLRAADVNEDGHVDLVLAAATGMEVLLGHGDGSFDPPLPVGAARTIMDLDLADVNADGDLDLVAGSLISDDLTLQLGHGDGRFGSFFPTPAASPRSLVVDDMDGDGEPDIVAAGYDAVSVLLGSDDALFGPAQATNALNEITTVVTGDFDEDGDPDVILLEASFLSPRVAQLENLGGGVLGAPVDLGGGSQSQDAVVVDIDADGHLDLLTADTASHRMGVYLGHGDGSFDPPLSVDTWFTPLDLAVGDFDGDGHLDVASAHNGSGDSLQIALGLGDGTFKQGFATNIGGAHGTLEAGDLDGDGVLDLAVTGSPLGGLSGGLLTLRGLGDGSFEAPVIHQTELDPEGLALGDLDQDGWLDVVVACERRFFDQGWMTVFFGGPAGLSAPQQLASATNPTDVVLADVDGDGALDALLAASGNGQVEVKRNLLGPWTNRGEGLAGSAGIPRQWARGPNATGAPFEFALTDARPSTPCWWVLGLSDLSAPFKGGVLVPTPDLLVGGLPIGPDGDFAFGGPGPALPAGIPLWYQFWVPDPAAPAGFAASNAIQGLTF